MQTRWNLELGTWKCTVTKFHGAVGDMAKAEQIRDCHWWILLVLLIWFNPLSFLPSPIHTHIISHSSNLLHSISLSLQRNTHTHTQRELFSFTLHFSSILNMLCVNTAFTSFLPRKSTCVFSSKSTTPISCTLQGIIFIIRAFTFRAFVAHFSCSSLDIVELLNFFAPELNKIFFFIIV